jgi:hypothetical protein
VFISSSSSVCCSDFFLFARQWREKQREEIEGHDAASKRRQEDTIATAERDTEEFYEGYAEKKERSIRENK